MPLKIENGANGALPKSFAATIETIISVLPQEHLRGLDRVRVVNVIDLSHLKNFSGSQLPGLYHPKQGAQPAWIEIALNALLPSSTPLYKRVINKLTYKSNLAILIFSLVGQHHFLTLRHSIKRSQLRSSVTTYSEKYLKIWSANQYKFRSKLFAPLRPKFEKWSRTLNKKVGRGRTA